jgi:hypothetical protein
MPATSQQQQKLFGLALSVKRGETPRSEVSDEVLQIVDTMSEKKIKDFAETSHKGLPTKVETVLRGLVRETFRNKILGESSRRSKDFFEDGKYGKELNKLFGGKFDGNKFDKFIDAIDKKSTDTQFERILNFMGGQIGMNIRSYDKKPMQVFIDDLKKEVEKLYKIHNESVNESNDSSSYKSVVDILKTLHSFSNKIKFRIQYINGYYNIVYDDTNQLTKNSIEALKNRKFWNTMFGATTANFGNDRINIRFEKPAQEILNIEDFDKKNWKPNKLKESVNETFMTEEVEQLDEKLIVYSNRAPYGQVVFIAGGAGSGKGFAIKNFIDSASFKVRDVDEMKKQLQQLNSIGKLSIQQIVDRFGRNIKPVDLEIIQRIQKDGFDLKSMNLKNPDHVYGLHILVKVMGIKDKSLENMLGAASNPEVLPNIMFDITAKEIADITDVIPQLISAGYKPQNIHLVWVLTNYDIAIEQNKGRDRVVPADILLKTHIGAGNTIWGLVTKALPKGMNGRVDVVLNNQENSVYYTQRITDKKSGKKKTVISGFLSLPIKKQGGGILPEKLWKDILYKWIKENGPKELTANM